MSGDNKNSEIRSKAIKKIMEAALIKFSNDGYHSTTIRGIANHYGIGYGNIYHYFKSKDELFSALVEESLKYVLFVVESAIKIDGNSWNKLENLAKRLFSLFSDSFSYRYFIIELEATTQARHIEGLYDSILVMKEKFNKILLPLIIEAQKDGFAKGGDPFELTISFFSLFQGYAFYVMTNSEWGKFINYKSLLSVITNNLSNN